MTLFTAIFVVLLVGVGMWLIWKNVPDPWKTIFLVLLGVGLVWFLLRIMGVLTSLNTTI